MIFQSEVLTSEFIKITKTYYKDGVHMQKHAHDFTSISLVLNGSLEETVDSKLQIGGIAETLIKPKGTIHENYFSKDCHILSISLQDARILNQISQNVLNQWRWISNVHSIRFFLSILKCNSDQDYIRLINNWMKHLSNLLVGRQQYLIPQWLKEAKSYIDSNYAHSLRSDELALRFGVHRVYLARVFRKFYGISIKEYLNALRVHNAIGSITMKEQSFTQTAHENGFADQSHFNRKFKEQLEITPGELRQLIGY